MNVLTWQSTFSIGFLFLSSVLILLLLAGLSLISAGMVRAKNTIDVLTKSLIAIAVSALCYVLVGHYAISAESNFYGLLPKLSFQNEISVFTTLSSFFHMFLAAIPLVTIVGVTAERLKLWAFLLFAPVMSLVIFPVILFWCWGNGFLYQHGFIDAAGCGVVYLTSAVSAITSLWIIGIRFDRRRQVAISYARGANLPLSVIGLFLFWIGSFGLYLGSFVSKIAPDHFSIEGLLKFQSIFINTSLAVAAGLLMVVLVLRVFYERTDLTLMLNGAMAAIVSIAASPEAISIYSEMIIAAIGALTAVIVVLWFEKNRIDDPIGFIACFGIGGIWGLIAGNVFQPETTQQQILIQLLAIVVISVWSFVTTAIAWKLISWLIGMRVTLEDEYRGLDLTHYGMQAYPEFTLMGEEQ